MKLKKKVNNKEDSKNGTKKCCQESNKEKNSFKSNQVEWYNYGGKMALLILITLPSTQIKRAVHVT